MWTVEVIDAALAGLADGGLYALIGVTVMVMFRMGGVLNFAVALLGTFGAFVTVSVFEHGVPLGLALLIGTIVAACLAGLMGAIIAVFFGDANLITRSVATVGMMVGLFAVAFRLFGDSPHSFPVLVSGRFTIGRTTISMTSVLAVGLAVMFALTLWLVLRGSRLGFRLAAMSARPVTAELLGIPVRIQTIGVWAVSGAAATVALMMVAPTRPADVTSLGLVVVPALAAALLGGFRSFGLTVIGGLGIGIVQSVSTRWESFSAYRDTLPFFAIMAVLIWSQRTEAWDDAR